MSVQLIVYPQSYNGSSNAISNNPNQFLIDGQNFSTLNVSSSFVSSASPSLVMQDAIDNYSSIAVNTWARYRNTVSNIPAEISGSLVFTPSTNAGTGVIQKLSNLTVGTTYEVTIVVGTSTTGTFTMRLYTGTVLQSSTIYNSPSGTITAQFTANSTSDTILFDFDTGGVLAISSISIMPKPQRPSDTISDLSTGEVIVDLYEDEDIPLTLSVDEFKNVAEKVQSYSKAFNLPATKRNNKIFDNIFEITRTDDGIVFNPYVKTQCVLKQDGYILFEGFLRLIDVSDKSGEISYNVNLYSEVIALADVLKDKTFQDLDFSELDHDYDKDNIKNSWVNTTGITLTNPLSSTNSFAYSSAIGNLTNTNVLKYPFVDWTGQILLANGSTGNNAVAGFPELTALEQAFRPFIKIKYIIDKIFADTEFTYSSDFFDTANFGTLYMDFNWGEGNAPNDIFAQGEQVNRYNDPNNFAGTSYSNVVFPSTNNVSNQPFFNVNFPSDAGFDSGTSTFTAPQDNVNYSLDYFVEIIFLATTTLTIEWFTSTNQVIDQQVVSGTTNDTYMYSGSFNTSLNTGDTLVCRFKNSTGANHIRQRYSTSNNNASVSGTISSQLTTNASLLNTLRGEVGQWDFLSGLIKMFNLVTMPDPDNPNNIIIEPYSDVFISNTAGTNLSARSIQHDWTNKIDVSEMKLTPLVELNKHTEFKFVEDDDDYAFNLYKKSTSGFLYGSKEFDASTSATGLPTLFTGTKEIIAEPFAATIIKPIASQFSNFIIPVIYKGNDDGSTEGFENSPRIVHINTKKELDNGMTYYIPAQNGGSSENQTHFLQASHLSAIPTQGSSGALPTTTDINFGECQLFSPLNPVVDNLYNTYWSPYYNELYNADTRIMTIKVNLNAADINTFKFSDKVMLKNRVFRVNRIDYKPNDLATVEFILIP